MQAGVGDVLEMFDSVSEESLPMQGPQERTHGLLSERATLSKFIIELD